MLTRESVFQSRDTVRIWEKFCGFLDLSVQEFMDIQNELLMEEIELVADSPLGKKIMKNQKPNSLEEYRKLVPLTTYEDYAPYIGNCQEDALSSKPALWVHTAGRSGSFKWVPYTNRSLERYADAAMAGLILSCTDRKNEVKITEGSKFLFILAPRPYMSGISAWTLTERFGLKVIPPLEVSESLGFQERIALGFKIAMRSEVDVIGAVSTVLLKVGEQFAEQSSGMKFSLSMLHPFVVSRLIRAWVRSKTQHRKILPQDLWPVKGLGCGGTDTGIYRDKLIYYWGQPPFESYGFTEGGIVAMQSWLKKGMVFYPYLTYFEFVPEDEWLKSRDDKNYQPKTLLINETKPGKIYELVITSFNGMPFLRYRPGDLIRITQHEEKESGIKLPQFEFVSRADDLIDLYSIVRLDEKTLWQALINTSTKYEEWTARKEYEDNMPVLRFYIEPKQDTKAEILNNSLHEQLLSISPLYREAIGEMRTNPVRVTLLSSGSFQRYQNEKQKAGVDLANTKPSHMNVRDTVIQDLIK